MSQDQESNTPAAAADQAAEFLGVFNGQDFDLGSGQTWRLPNPHLIPPAMKKRWLEHLRFINKELDKEKVADPITGKQRLQTVWPLTYKGDLIDEDELLCIALMGEDAVKDREAYFKDGTLPATYERFLEADGVPGQVQIHWRVMNLQMEERLKRDPKSR